jgi:hypothetical protein
VHLEQTGRLYEAIRYYKRAVLLVPDIEYQAFQYTARAAASKEKRNDNQLTAGKEGAGADENGNKKLVEVPAIETLSRFNVADLYLLHADLTF